jgi:hypothetical protein
MRGLKVNPVVVVCVIDGSVAFGAPFLNYFFKRGDVALQAGAGMIAAATFLGVWTAQRKRVGPTRPTEAMRDAIAASFVLTYLVAVGWAAFFNYVVGGGPPGTLSPLTASLITNFTALTGIVVGSYFGLTAIQQVTQSQERRIRGHEPPPAPAREEEEEAHTPEGEAERGGDRPGRP